MLNDTILKTYIDFNDNTIIKNQLPNYQGDNNFKFRQGRIDWQLELVPINGNPSSPIILEEATTKAYVYSKRINKPIADIVIKSIDKNSGTITIEGQKAFTHEFGKNVLIIETSKGASWNCEYEVAFTPGYSETIPPFNADGYYTISQIDKMLNDTNAKIQANSSAIAGNEQKIDTNTNAINAKADILALEIVKTKVGTNTTNISKNAEDIKTLQNSGGGGITIETDPIFTAKEPTLAKTSLENIEDGAIEKALDDNNIPNNVLLTFEGGKFIKAKSKRVEYSLLEVGNAGANDDGKTFIYDYANKRYVLKKPVLDVNLFYEMTGQNTKDLKGSNGKYLRYNATTSKFELVDAPTKLDPADDKLVKSEIDNKLKTALSAINTQLSNKLNTDFGNADLQGLSEKLSKEGVALKSELPKKYRAPFMVEDDEIQQGDPVIINQDCTNLNLNLQGTEGQEFTYQLPNFADYPNLEHMRIKLVTSQENDQDNKRTQYVIRTPHQVFVGGARTMTFDNIKLAIVDLYPDREDNKWVADLIYNEAEETESEDITFTSALGKQIIGKEFNFGRSFVFKEDKRTSIYEDEASPEISSYSTTDLQTSEVIDLAPSIYNAIIGNDSYMAQPYYDEELRPATSTDKPVRAKLWFDNIIKNTIGFIEIDRNNKRIGVQDGIIGDDPNISGGEVAIFGVAIYLNGKATEDGYITIELVDSNTQLPILDAFGKPVMETRKYKKGDEFGKFIFMDIQAEKGIKYIEKIVEHNFINDTPIISWTSQELIQMVQKDNKLGLALNSFEQDNDIKFNFGSTYVGNRFSDWTYEMAYLPQGTQEIDAQGYILANNGSYINFASKAKVTATPNSLLIEQSDSGDMLRVAVGQVFNLEKLRMIQPYNSIVHVTTKTPVDATIIGAYKWIGNSEPKYPILTGFVNSNYAIQNGWVKIADKFISEDVTNTEKDYTFKFANPTDGTALAVLIYPEEVQSPNSLFIKNFYIDVDADKEIYYKRGTTDTSIKYRHINNTIEFAMLGFGSGLRYTINSSDTKLPVGVPKVTSGDQAFINKLAWKDSGYKGEGIIEAKTDVEIDNIEIEFPASLFIGEKAQKNKPEDLTIKLCKGNTPDNPIAQEYDFIMNKPGALTYSFKFDTPFTLLKGEDLWLFGKALRDKGLYIQASEGQPLIKFTINFKENVSN